MADAGGQDQADGGSREAPYVGGEREGAYAALGAVLLWNPQRVHREIRAAHAQEEKARHEPAERGFRQVEHVAERQRNEDEHQREEEREGVLASEALTEPGGHHR